MRRSSWLPKTIAGFPVHSESTASSPGHRGVALLIAIMAVAIIMIFSSNMIVTSSVGLELAVAERDNIKAEYMARSGQNLAIFALMADSAIDLSLYQQMQKEPTDSGDDIWGQLNGLPIGGETMEMMAATQKTFDLSSISDTKVMDTLKLFDGQFTMEIEDEMSRINVSNCFKGTCTETTTMLTALMSCPSEKLFLEKKNLRPLGMAMRIKDYVDENKTAEEETGFSTEDDPYERKTPPYAAKNAPLESVNELMLVEGWDEEMHAVFGKYLTIFPYVIASEKVSKINVNTAKKELLACLIPNAKTDCAEKFFKLLIKQQTEGGTLATDKQSLTELINSNMCDVRDETQGDKAEWFGYRTKFFRVRTTGDVGLQTRTLETVIERGIPDKASKIDSSYQILYWKMI